jgi:hypothetical protein
MAPIPLHARRAGRLEAVPYARGALKHMNINGLFKAATNDTNWCEAPLFRARKIRTIGKPGTPLDSQPRKPVAPVLKFLPWSGPDFKICRLKLGLEIELA